MTEGSPQPGKSRRIDPPERIQGRRARRRGAERCAKRVLSDATAAAEAAASSFGTLDAFPGASTLRDQLEAHARSLGEALITRQAEIDRREADVHARLGDLESMRRELELWREGERSNLADQRSELERRSARQEAEARDRRRELDRREETLKSACSALERNQAKLEELQRRCEETMRRFDATAETPVASLTPLLRQGDASTERASEAQALVRELAGATVFRIVRPDADHSTCDLEASPSATSATATPAESVVRDAKPAPASHELIRLHEALLDRERFLADEARKFERERKAFAEIRMNWIEERLRDDRKPEVREALSELRSLRAEVDRERQDRVQVQKRRHQRMQHLLEAIEDEITRLDIAWASVPQR